MSRFAKRTPLAWLNLVDNKPRALLSVAGVGFAVLLVFMQLGFRGAVSDTATVVFDQLRFDAMLRSPEYLHLYESRSFDKRIIEVVAGVPGVQRVEPMQVQLGKWQCPSDGRFRAIALLGIPVDSHAFLSDEVQRLLPQLTRSDALLIDRTTSRDYGPRDGKRFGEADIGATTELNGKQVVIQGTYRIGSGLAASGAAIVSEQGYRRIFAQLPAQQVSLGLVQLDPRADRQATLSAIDQALRDGGMSSQSQVLSRDQVVRFELRRWMQGTPIGAIFQMGVALSLLVGGAIVYMVLSADVASRMGEYATLKAMGYTHRALAGVVLRQGALLATMAVPAALLAAIGLYRVTTMLAGVPLGMTVSRIGLVSVLTLGMCLISAALVLRKLFAAQPADLF
jgi:putative ABC transport system permease protein